MPTDERDPRVNPRPRDKIRTGPWIITVVAVMEDVVTMHFGNPLSPNAVTLDSWRQDTRNAEVISRGE